MRVQLERTFLTTPAGVHIPESDPEVVVVESPTVLSAIVEFIADDHARLLGSIAETGERATATVWKGRVYLLAGTPLG